MKKLTFALGKYRFQIYDRPGCWMKKKELDGLQRRLTEVAEKRLKKAPTFSFFKDTRHLGNKLVIFSTDRKTGEDLCYCVMAYLGHYRKRSVLHLGAVYSVREDKGMMKLVYTLGLMHVFVKNWFFKRVYLTSLTHTPKIFGVVHESFEHVYPNHQKEGKPGRFHLNLRDIFFDTYLKEWDLEEKPSIDTNFVIKGFRKQQDGSILYPDTVETVPRHRKEKYNKRCTDLLNYEKGDEIFQAGLSYGFLTILKNTRVFSQVFG